MSHRTVRIPADLYSAVEAVAGVRGCTLGTVLADALIAHLPPAEVAAARRRFAATARVPPPERLPRPRRPDPGPAVPQPPPERLETLRRPPRAPDGPPTFRTPELRPRKIAVPVRPDNEWKL